MPIRDLLWVCPECGLENGLQRRGRREICSRCGTRFKRGAGASIIALTPGKSPVVRTAQEWMQMLPAADFGEVTNGAGTVGPRSAAVRLRRSVADKAIRIDGELLGFMERFGPPISGTLTLEKDAVVFKGENGKPDTWRLDEITAVQPSSGSLQLKISDQPVLSLAFPGGSPRVWEELIIAALRAQYRRTGKGEIREFQPRIVTRPPSGNGTKSSGSSSTHG
jgi:hypothetical protein